MFELVTCREERLAQAPALRRNPPLRNCVVRGTFLLLIAAMPASTVAQECSSYIGRTITPVTIEAALARFSGLTPRGEFETTADFDARRARTIGTVGPLIIGKLPDGRSNGSGQAGRGDFFQYDADRGVMRVISYAFDNSNFSHENIWGYGAPLHREGDYTSRWSNVDVVITETNQTTGSYSASNAFGATRTVTRISRTISAIYDRPLPGTGAQGLFPGLGQDNVVGTIAMTPEEARYNKFTMTVAFVVMPHEPFVVASSVNQFRPTIERPTDVTVTTRVLFADIQCALVLSDRGTVLAAYVTN